MTLAPARILTPDDLLSLPDAVNYELVDGNLVERKMGSESSAIAMVIGVLLSNFVRGKSLGFVFGADGSYQCFPDAPDKVRKPDVSFIASARLPGGKPPKGHTKAAPDLAVEVISPNDLATEIDEKVAEYLAAGVKLVWVVSPNTRTVRVHRPGSGTIRSLSESETITGEDFLPGFECRVGEFFQL
jgi:Uma2 family endonuclease